MKILQNQKQKSLISYGTILRIGDNLLACGDARDTGLVNRLIGKEKIKLIVCDPPYGIKMVEQKFHFAKIKVNRNILNDDIISESQYAQFTRDWLIPIIPHLVRKNSAYIFNSDKMLFALRRGMESTGMKFSQFLIWIKNHSVIGRKDYLLQHELIVYGWHGAHEFMKSKDKSVLFYPKPNKSPLHPTMKPVGLLRNLILNSSRISDIVYDPFLGSGTTIIACHQTRRRCLAVEIDPVYCQTTIDRFEKLIGQKAQKI